MTAIQRERRRAAAAPDVSSNDGLFWLMTALVAGLAVFGLIMVLSASGPTAQGRLDSGWFFFRRQAFWLMLGTIGAIVAVGVDYHVWLRPRVVVTGMVTTVAALLVVLIPSPISINVNGANRWIMIGSQQFQPSEYAKLAVVFWFAAIGARARGSITDRRFLVRQLAVLAGVVGLVAVEPDVGTAALIGAVAGSILLVAGARWGHLAALAAIGSAALIVRTQFGYHSRRLAVFGDLWAHRDAAEAQQILSARAAFAEGGLFGSGLGQSRLKWGWLPEPQNDVIFAVIGDELGLLGAAVVLCAFVALVGCGLVAALRARDREGTLIAVGITTWIGLQAMINMGVTIGALPNKGITLPFVSYGGSSLVVTMFAAGLLLQVARDGADVPARPTSARPTSARSRSVASRDERPRGARS